MWIKEGYTPPAHAQPPEDSGVRLATFSRPRGEEIRLSVSYYDNKSYIRAQIWAENERGQMWPVKGRSITFRSDELESLVAALRGAGPILERGRVAPPPEDDGRPRFVERRRRPGRYDPRDLRGMPATPAGGEAFDECSRERP